jgi:hypothetical protein
MFSGLLAVNFEYSEEGLADGIALTDQIDEHSFAHVRQSLTQTTYVLTHVGGSAKSVCLTKILLQGELVMASWRGVEQFIERPTHPLPKKTRAKVTAIILYKGRYSS